MSDSQIFSDLKKRNNAAYDLLYSFYYPTIERFVKRNSGTSDDAKDVFQETIIVLLDKVPKEDFILTSSIKTYIMAVASNIWLKRLREARRSVAGSINSDPDTTLENWELPEFKISDEDQQRNILQRIFHKMTKHCVVFLT